ncbi:MAG: PAS domain S-box protein [Alphaproteobacteria bacterium]|nr:PAS domain S-box protein [Alphaproteobacteria bacterium]
MLASTVPLVVFGLVQEYVDYHESVERTGREKLLLARSLAISVDSELQRYITAMEMLSESKRLRDGDIPGFREMARSVVDQHFPGANILLLREDGQLVMHTSLPTTAPLPARKSLDQLKRVFTTGRPAISDMFAGQVANRNVIAVDVPVKDAAGRVIYVLTMNPPMAAFTEVIQRHAPPADWAVTVLDRNGLTVGRAPDIERYFAQPAGPTLLPSLLEEREGVRETVSRDGVPRLAAFTHSPTFGWAVVIGVARTELTAPAIDAALLSLGFGGVSILLSLALTLLMSNRIAGPIAALRRLATAYDQDIPYTPKRTGLPEADEVAHAFRLAQERRRRSDRRYRILFDTNPLSISVFDLETLRFLDVNDTMVAQYGWSKPEFLALTVFDVHPPEAQEALRRVIAERQRNYTIAQCHRDGTRFNAETVVRVIELEGRKVGIAIARDVTRELQMREQLHDAIKAFPGSFRFYDKHERLVLMNDKPWMPQDRPIAVSLGDTVEQTIHAAAVMEATEDSIGRPDEWARERLAQFRRADANCEVKTRDGRWHHLLESHTVDGGTLSVRLDITERKRIEAQLRQAQKMETIGQLAGGVAHDFNNSLAVVMASLENLLDVGPDDEARGYAETAMRATEQAASLTKRLLAFSRRQELTPIEVDVGASVNDLQKILRSSVPRMISLTVQPSLTTERCVLDRTGLETAVMNMVVNARDAIDGRPGRIVVAVDHCRLNSGEAAAIPGARAGEWTVVSVTDDGPGMSDDVKARIFEPFFTTKGVGKGTGLGLSQINGFVAQAKGFIRVQSALGKGTRFDLHFPSQAAA